MVHKGGTFVPAKGRNVRKPDYALSISEALRSELGTTHRATKTVMHWTGASDRSAKYWISGTRGPDGKHLMLLAQNCDAVMIAILNLTCRQDITISIEVEKIQVALKQATDVINAIQRRRDHG